MPLGLLAVRVVQNEVHGVGTQNHVILQVEDALISEIKRALQELVRVLSDPEPRLVDVDIGAHEPNARADLQHLLADRLHAEMKREVVEVLIGCEAL